MVAEFLSFFIVLFVVVAFISEVLPKQKKNTKSSTTNTLPVQLVPQTIPPQPNRESVHFKNWKNNQRSEILSKPSVFDLISKKKILEIRYSDLVYTREWYLKRLEVMLRDKYTCQDCSGRNSKNLQVHHNYYLVDRLPWDIEHSALVTLCRNHHQERHNGKTMPTYKWSNGSLIETENLSSYCTRCLGMGYFPEFRHVEDGICFRCRGECLDYTIFKKALLEVSQSDISIELDRVLNFISQNYFDEYLSDHTTENIKGGPIPTNLTEPLDDLPF